MLKRFHWTRCLLLAGMLAACGANSSGPTPLEPASPDQPSAQIHISSDAHAFDTSELRARADQDFEVIYRNRSDVPHNVAIYSDASAQVALYVGGIVRDSQVVYPVPALPPGLYFFRCDVHPSTMQGRLFVQ
jgi:plastocyanin